MTEGQRLAQAAADLVGVRFRLHGRDPWTGLDCVGLVAASLFAIGRYPAVPRGYRLRNTSIDQWLGLAERSAFRPVTNAALPGDLVLTTPGPAQNHLLIVGETDTIIHAHAGLGRVVRQQLPSDMPAIARWRLLPFAKDN